MQINYKKYLKIGIISSGILVVTTVFLFSLLFFLVYSGAFGSLPVKEEISDIQNEEASLVYSSDGEIIGKYFSMNRTNISMNEVPEHLKKAVLLTEDKRFYSHKGYDTRSYLRVIVRTILLGDESGGGGSTINQQLIKNLFGRKDYRFLSLPVNKIREAVIARRFENVYTKDEILILYLNSVPFGEDVYGVESASNRYFNKSAHELRVEESAVLAGMLKANTLYNPQYHPENSLFRRNLVINLMNESGYLNNGIADSLKNLPLELEYENLNLQSPAGYFVYQVRLRTEDILDSIQSLSGEQFHIEKDGLRIHTTLNIDLQRFGKAAIMNHLPDMQKYLDKELMLFRTKDKFYSENSPDMATDTTRREMSVFEWKEGVKRVKFSRFDSLWHYQKMLNASLLITDPADGAVLGWIGGNHYRYLPFDMVLSHRQIASAFKPVLYATAIESGISPCTYLENREKEYEGYEDWELKNADQSETPDSSVALWYALSHSMNIPSVDLYFRTGHDELEKTCNKLKFPSLPENAPSVAIGTHDISLYEIVRAYGSFANLGKMNDLFMISRIETAGGEIIYSRKSYNPDNQIFSESTVETITAILQQVIEQGTGHRIRSQYQINSELAGKTGTAHNYSDAWFISYTPDLVIGAWVGARNPEIHFNNETGSGSSLALPVVGGVIKEIEKNVELSARYLTSFNITDDTYLELECPAFKTKGIMGVVERLFGISPGKNKTFSDSLDKQENKKGSFFKRLFQPREKDK